MKFKSANERYLSERRKLSEQLGPRELWSVIDHWPLYCGIGNLGRFLAISDLLRETLPVPGHIAEFGSWRGANLMLMAKLLRILDPHGSKQTICFDSFAGLETFAPQDGQAARASSGQYRGAYDELRQLISLYELDDDIVIHAGDVVATLPAALKDESLSFSFIYCDLDLYAPTKLVLDSIHPRLSKGGLIILDEWNHEKWPGESIAVREFLAARPEAYRMRHVRAAAQPTLALEKLL